MKSELEEIPLKQWFYEQAERDNLSLTAIQRRYYRGLYPLKIRRVNARIVMVKKSKESF